MIAYLDVPFMLVCSWSDWSSSIGSNPAAYVVLGAELSTALTRYFDGSYSPTTLGEMQVLCYTG